MDKELLRALSEMDEIIKAWNNHKIAKEEDFLHVLRLVNARITLLLPKQEEKSKQLSF